MPRTSMNTMWEDLKMSPSEIWLIDFCEPFGSLPSKLRPSVIMQNDLFELKDLNTARVNELS